uniref:Uncharacterized protein n=1 Tax=Glossina brevipalpis TaxID=37001 RepID=A0A1A9WXA8_9MUSC
MLYLIQRGKVRSQVINVPEGLPEVLSDIAREVLRCQPTTECLCQFIVDYMHSVISAREKARVAKSVIDRTLCAVNEVISDMCVCDISKEKSELICTVMEDCFRRFLAKRHCELGKEEVLLKFNEIDILDELIMKCKFSEIEIKTSRPIIEAASQRLMETYMMAENNTEAIDALYEYFREREQKRAVERKRQSAAVKIQAWYRGSHLRKSLHEDRALETQQPQQESSETEQMILVRHMAARKIQQFFRNRLSSIRDKHSMLQNFPEICEPKSKLSMTVRPSGYDLHTEENDYGDNLTAENIPQHFQEANIPDMTEISNLMGASKEIVDGEEFDA